jgi:septation ring formation regulator EzrA
MAIEDDLSRAEKALKDRLTNAGKIARDITNKAFKELVASIEEYGRSLDQITNDLDKQLNLYSEIKIQAKGFGEALKNQLPYIKENKDLSQKLVGIYKEENKLLDKLVRYQEDLITGELDYNQAAKAVAEIHIYASSVVAHDACTSRHSPSIRCCWCCC